jgi:hypothetical protein
MNLFSMLQYLVALRLFDTQSPSADLKHPGLRNPTAVYFKAHSR